MNRISGYVADVVGILGGALVSFGTWQISHAAGLIVAGVLLIAGSILGTIGAGPVKP